MWSRHTFSPACLEPTKTGVGSPGAKIESEVGVRKHCGNSSLQYIVFVRCNKYWQQDTLYVSLTSKDKTSVHDVMLK